MKIGAIIYTLAFNTMTQNLNELQLELNARYKSELKRMKRQIEHELKEMDAYVDEDGLIGSGFHPSITIDTTAENIAEHVRVIRFLKNRVL